MFWDVALVSPFTKEIKGKYERNVFVFYLFLSFSFLYISYGPSLGKALRQPRQRGVKPNNQNMESDNLRQHRLALSH